MDNMYFCHVCFDRTDEELGAILDRMQKAREELEDCLSLLRTMGLIIKTDRAPSDEGC
ncbi:MAG: hypothetical protein IKS10_04650 [Lachnospiraceae bacterium]|nr:hypothetical protein [Lachnospiraceae bacterium]